MIRRALLGAVLLVALAAAPAAAQYDPNTVTPGQAVGGTQVTVTGSGCQPNQVIEITVYPESPEALAGNPTVPPVISVTTTADENGNYTVSFRVPDDLAPGWYDVLGPCPPRTTDLDIERAARAPQLYLIGRFLVVEADVPPGPGTGTGGGNLPRTGSDLNAVGLVGAGLLTAGGLVLVATNRRRRTASA